MVDIESTKGNPIVLATEDAEPKARFAISAATWLAVCIGLGLLYSLVLSTSTSFAWDDGLYPVLGKSLASWKGYRAISAPGQPIEAAHPPLYASLLALIWFVWPAFPQNLVALKGLNVPLALVAVVSARRFFLELPGARPTTANAAAATVALGSAVLVFLDFTMTEMFYLATSMAALASISGYSQRDETTVRGWCARSLLAAIPAWIRAIGISLPLSMCLWLALNRRWRDLTAVAGTTMAALLPWQIWVRGVMTSGQPVYLNYAAWLDEVTGTSKLDVILHAARDNAATLLGSSVPHLVVPLLPAIEGSRHLAWLGVGPSLGVLAMVALGLLATAKPRIQPWHLYLLIYFAVVVPFPWPPDRYAGVVSPLLLYAFILAAEIVGRGMAKKLDWQAKVAGDTSAIVACTTSCIWGLAVLGTHLAHPLPAIVNVLTSRPVLGSVDVVALRRTVDLTPPSSMIVATPEFLVYLLTERKTCRPPQTSPFAWHEFRDALDRFGSGPVYWLRPSQPGVWEDSGAPAGWMPVAATKGKAFELYQMPAGWHPGI